MLYLSLKVSYIGPRLAPRVPSGGQTKLFNWQWHDRPLQLLAWLGVQQATSLLMKSCRRLFQIKFEFGI